MTSKKENKGTTSGNLPALKIGSRVRCRDDGVEGRITWANGVSVKVQWDDGEQVTWRRDSLADRPIEILDPASEAGNAAMIAADVDVKPGVSTGSLCEEPSLVPPVSEAATTDAMQSATETTGAVIEPVAAKPVLPVPEPAEGKTAVAISDATVQVPVQSKRRRKAPAVPKAKKRSALDAAAQVLVEAGQTMTCQEMIAVMAQKGYWTSPKGRTPVATLYASILRETQVKGATSRFQKTERGKFARTDVA
jgi:hypothetical protein